MLRKFLKCTKHGLIHNCLCSAKLTEFSYKSYNSVLLRQKTLIMLKENQRRTAARGRDGGGQASWQQCPRLLGQVTKGTRAEFKVGSR